MSDQGTQRSRILIVEDEGIVARDIERCLEDNGFDVTAIAASAEDAMREASATCPDLVLMDIRIQGPTDGIDAGNQLRQQFGLPIIYLTAHGDRDTLERAKKTDPIAYLLKPFKSSELIRAVEIALNRNRAEKGVRERERSFNSAMDSIGDAVLTTDAQGCVRFMNRAAEELTGWRQEQALGHPATEIVHVVDELTGDRSQRCRMLPGLEPASAKSCDSGDEYRILAGDGTYRWLKARTSSIAGADGSSVRITVMQDVTRHKTAELALRRQADLLELSHEPILTWDINGPISYWNHGAEVLYGFTRQEVLGRTPDELLRSGHPSGIVAIDTALARDGQWSGELTQTTKDGRQIVVESLMMVVEEPSGRKTVLETNRDITERKRTEMEIRCINAELEQRVQERTAQLEAANKELEAFAYSVSHDLRAPLRGIDGWSLALEEDYRSRLDVRGHEYLERLRAEAQRMGTLIDDLLELSRIGRAEMQRSPVDLSRVAATVAGRLKEEHRNRQIEFEIHPGLTVEGDARLLEVALTNLLGNAVKFTGTRVPARIEFGRTPVNGERAFFIRDNGVGFDMAYAGTLFAPFHRLHKRCDFPGTGIGLATVQRVIHRHGGRVWAEAKPGEGATFFFVLGRENEPG